MAQLVSDGYLQQASTLYTIDWTSGLALTGTAGCTGQAEGEEVRQGRGV